MGLWTICLCCRNETWYHQHIWPPQEKKRFGSTEHQVTILNQMIWDYWIWLWIRVRRVYLNEQRLLLPFLPRPGIGIRLETANTCDMKSIYEGMIKGVAALWRYKYPILDYVCEKLYISQQIFFFFQAKSSPLSFLSFWMIHLSAKQTSGMSAIEKLTTRETAHSTSETSSETSCAFALNRPVETLSTVDITVVEITISLLSPPFLCAFRAFRLIRRALVYIRASEKWMAYFSSIRRSRINSITGVRALTMKMKVPGLTMYCEIEEMLVMNGILEFGESSIP